MHGISLYGLIMKVVIARDRYIYKEKFFYAPMAIEYWTTNSVRVFQVPKTDLVRTFIVFE